MRQRLKRVIAAHPLLLRLLNRFIGNFPKILVYHRFAPAGASMPHRVNAETFAWQLDTLMRDFEVISFGECIARFLQHGRWPQGCVVLTIDDGYCDMYQWAWPELAKRRLPATFFVTTGFIDGTLWLWPDRIEYALLHSRSSECAIFMAGKQVLLDLGDAQERASAWKMFSDYCISLPDDQRQAFIKQVEELLGVELPIRPPPEYAAVTWGQLREMQAGGVEIGGHTINHPILSKIDPNLLDQEIGLCRQILMERLSCPISTFCYTNSGPNDINDAVIASVAKAGYRGAVFGTNLSTWDLFQVPRMGISDDRIDFLWKLYGGESLTFKSKRERV